MAKTFSKCRRGYLWHFHPHLGLLRLNVRAHIEVHVEGFGQPIDCFCSDLRNTSIAENASVSSV